MSAWDITGAVCWGILTITGWRDLKRVTDKLDPGPAFLGMMLVLAVTGAFIFCVARLFGAKL